MNPKLQNIDHIHIFVSDRREALDWYNNILGLKPLEKLISLPKSGPLMIRNNEGNINIALFKGEPQDNRSVIAFKVTGEEFINCHDRINQTIPDNIELVDHSSQYSIYFEDKHTHGNYAFMGNRYYECVMCDVLMLFDSKCLNTIKKSGYDIPKELVVDNGEQANHVMDSMDKDDGYYNYLLDKQRENYKEIIKNKIILNQCNQ